MQITLDEAILIYARASRAWFGSAAIKRTQERIDELRGAGDLDGVRVWERVKKTIAELEKTVPVGAHDFGRRHCA